LTWNAATGTTLVATVFADPTTNSGAGGSDPRQRQAAIRLINNPDPSSWESKRSIGGTDYGLRLSQLFGSTALLTAQASRHQDRFELTPSAGGTAPRLDDFTCSGGTENHRCLIPSVPNFSSGGLGRIAGFFNRNSSHREQYSGDASLYLGRHELKLGGDYQQASTHAIDSFTGGQRVRRFNERGQTYYQHAFFAVSTQDLTSVDEQVARGATRDLGAYFQDTWRIGPGWTINAGLRWDEETIRDYRGETILLTTNEWQPRLGVVWDPRRDGRTKIYAFAGRFYYSLPTDLVVRSFGNQTIVRTYNFDPVSLTQDSSVLRHTNPDIFGGAFATPVDNNLKGDYQDELTIGVEKLLTQTFSVALKGTYRRLGNVIEDRCDLDYNRPETNYSGCALINPGSGGRIARGDLPGCSGLYADDPDNYPCTDTSPPTPPARRVYRGVEVLGRKSFSESLWLQASYLYSSLRGNYDGGVRGDGQTDPGINFDFDYPEMYHNSYGRLYLDRPHSFRVDGYYATPFKLFVGLQAYVQSGAPESRLGYLNQYSPGTIQLVKRGTEGRLPTVWEANLTLGYPFRVGPATVTVQAYVFNLFNNQIATSRDDSWSNNAPPDYPASLYDPNQEQNDPEYGKTTSRQEPRSIRGSLKISF
jgi:hypothetical protein